MPHDSQSLTGQLMSLTLAALCSMGCSSALDSPSADGGTGPAAKPETRPNGPSINADVQVVTPSPIGWASVDVFNQNGTTGGGDVDPISVGTLAELMAAVAGAAPAVVQIIAPITGSIRIGSNKTVQGMPGAVFTGHVGFRTSVNVIIRNLTIVGNNCTDADICEDGDDAVTIANQSHHIWIDHCDISNGSDGNLDVTTASDYVTISWTKFWYQGQRAGGHQFSNLIGSSDDDTGDTGHLRVTFHHDWWADNVRERMPRARFGQIHLFNNLYTAINDLYCVGLGVGASILLESNAFVAVRNPVDIYDYSNAASMAVSYGNLYDRSLPAGDLGAVADIFNPPYSYTLEPAGNVQNTVMQHAGTQ